ncbi:porin [Marinoscillum sp.]|uniref:porin n=1 Tax=Marinoscillum sp. TaxID=2024838 RepID=UPI003BA84837
MESSIRGCFTIVLFSVCLFYSGYGLSQIPIDASWGKGIRVEAKDSSFSLKLGLRFQTLYEGEKYLESGKWNEQLLIRRYRLKFDGYAFQPNIKYKMELGISNRDSRSGSMEEIGHTANIILDAVVKWEFTPGVELWVGQTKLPGNRERVVSSQNMQFVDRSLVNSRFNLDRDIGLQLRAVQGSGVVFRESLAISLGEGRGVVVDNPDNGRQYTTRLEVLPMGLFKSKGDYMGADTERQPSPKLAVGVTYDYNQHTPRSRGNLGSFLTDSDDNFIYSDLSTWLVDAVFKYQGLSWNAEYAHRSASDEVAGFGYGKGFVTALGYVFKSNYEIAGRYTTVEPLGVNSSISEAQEYTLGFSKYIVGHSLKVQSDISYMDTTDDYLRFRVQMELAL